METEKVLHKAFTSLKQDVRDQVKLLEKASTKRELTEEEKRIIRHLKNDLDEAEKFVKKEIKNIEKEVE